jgi:hypothetical protein
VTGWAGDGPVSDPITFAYELASWWHTDADLGRQVETFADMSKSRTMGFLDHQPTYKSFTDLFNELRAAKIVPTW